MKASRLIALLIAIVMGWSGFASSSFAYSGSSTEIVTMSADHPTGMGHASLQDCPGHKVGQMKMDLSQCVVACYGLASPVVFEPILFSLAQGIFNESARELESVFVLNRAQGVPTPPPNFA